ncbi:VOC family protein [Ruegeria sp. SCPT10]|uniref:VOC family protein n=1 Tax=Ruegeria sp. SCP10 TaxID=3141377 RepID=UPI003337A141
MSLNYVMIGSNDVAKARKFYDTTMAGIGGKVVAEYMPYAVCYQLRDGGRIWVSLPNDQKTAKPGNGNMVGLMCESEDEVRKVHAIAMANGGTNEGDPGPRPQYGPDFFGAYARDLDGNKMSFVYFSDSD